jgi:RNA polymerase sigma-70 factor (ECF subfamily)
MQELHDADIVKAVLQGNKAAYAVLVERYQSFVFTIVSRLVRQREEAEDVAQEVFVKAYLSLAGFKGSSKFSTWLYTISHTTAISYLRKHRPDTLFADSEHLVDYMDSKNSTGAEQLSNSKTIKEAVNTAIKLLPADDAEIITLFYLAEQSIEEIAIIMSLQTSNVKVKLHRARLKMKDIVERTYGNETTLLYKN